MFDRMSLAELLELDTSAMSAGELEALDQAIRRLRVPGSRDARTRIEALEQRMDRLEAFYGVPKDNDLEIPRFLAPDPLKSVPAGLQDLAKPGETAAEMQARLWSLWLELNGKLMLGLATADETILHSRLHNELHWFAPALEGEL